MTFTLAVEILKFLDATKVPDDMTVGELRALLEHARGQPSMCHNCRRPITEDGPGGTWVHADPSALDELRAHIDRVRGRTTRVHPKFADDTPNHVTPAQPA